MNQKGMGECGIARQTTQQGSEGIDRTKAYLSSFFLSELFAVGGEKPFLTLGSHLGLGRNPIHCQEEQTRWPHDSHQVVQVLPTSPPHKVRKVLFSLITIFLRFTHPYPMRAHPHRHRQTHTHTHTYTHKHKRERARGER
jgi:hypothetical protein